jgi:hypothetical protein
MKKISLAVLAMVAICTAGLKAQNIAIASSVKENFNNEFRNASNVNWEKVNNNVVLVRFNENNLNKLAYYGSDGKLLMEGRKISFESSPRLVQKSVNSIMESYREKKGILQVVQTYEITDQDQTRYFLNVGNASLQLALMSGSNGSCQVLRKVESTPLSNTNILANNK